MMQEYSKKRNRPVPFEHISVAMLVVLPLSNLEFSLAGVSITSDEGGFDEGIGQRCFAA